MPFYSYKGFDVSSGALKRGRVEADSIKSAKSKVRSKLKIIVSDLKEEASKSRSGKRASLFEKKVTLSDLSVMTRQFATLQKAHVPLDEFS